MEERLAGAALGERADLALRIPLVAALGVVLLHPADPTAGVVFTVGDGIADNGTGGLHAAALGAVLELGAYLALLGHLHPGEHAVTHAVSTQLLAAARHGDRVEIRADPATRTRRLGFVAVTAATAAGILARAQVTKSVVRFSAP